MDIPQYDENEVRVQVLVKWLNQVVCDCLGDDQKANLARLVAHNFNTVFQSGVEYGGAENERLRQRVADLEALAIMAEADKPAEVKLDSFGCPIYSPTDQEFYWRKG